jgi:exopolyphosphatase/guanosine-5'-triphosphate,3'-diphosphate pyrophosphatase
MRVASLDIGTNTFLCLICEVENGRITEIYEDLCEVVRLGEGVHAHRKFSQAALERAEATLTYFRRRMDDLSVEKVSAVATSAARDVSNKQGLLDMAFGLQIPLRIISGKEEARLTFLGAMAGCLWPSTDVVVVDIGGGSTEIISIDANDQVVSHSFDLGVVRLKEMFFHRQPPTAKAYKECEYFVRSELAKYASVFQINKQKFTLAVAGTPTTLAAVSQSIDFSQSQIEGYSLSLAEISQWEERFLSMTLEEIQGLPGMHEKRADVILAGTLLLRMIGDYLDIQEYVVSTRGVRFGLAQSLN